MNGVQESPNRVFSPVLMLEEHVVRVGPDFSWGDLKDTLAEYLGKLQEVMDGDTDKDLPLLPEFCKKLEAFIKAPVPDNAYPFDILKEWIEAVDKLKAEENAIAEVDIPAISLEEKI